MQATALTMEKAAPKSRAVLVAIAAVAGLAELAYAIMNVSAMPVYLKFSMGYGEATIAGIGTAFLLFEGVMKGPFGVVGDRIGRKWLILVGPLISVITSLLTLLIKPHQWYLFVLLRVLDGVGAAALWPSALAMIADVIPEEKRSQAMSLFNVTYLLGIALGPLIGGIANDLTKKATEQVKRYIIRHGPHITRHMVVHTADPRQASFYVISFLFLLTAAVAYWRLPNIRPHHESHPEHEAGFSFSAITQALRQIPQMLLMAFVTFFGIGMIMLIIKLFALAEFDISETQFGALLLAPALIIAAASVPLGTIGDKIGKAAAVRLGIGICAFSLLFMIIIRNQLALVIGGSINGIGFVIAFPSWMAYISSTCDKRQRGAVMGAVGTAQGVGAMLGAPLGGYLYEKAHIHLPRFLRPFGGSVPFLKLGPHIPGHAQQVYLNPHYAPFIGCALMLFIAWILAMLTVHDTPQTAGTVEEG